MLKKMRSKDRSVLFSWVVSYFSVLLIPIIISTVVYVESSNIIEKEIAQANNVLLKQVQHAIDGKINDIERLSLQIAWNPRLQGLLYKKQLTDYHRYTISLILEDFRLYKVANSFIDDFFVYLPNSEIVLNPQSVYDMQFYLNNIQNTDRINLAQWQELQKSHHVKDYMLLEVKDPACGVRKNMAFVHSLPWESTSEKAGTLVVLLDELHFLDSIKNIDLIHSGNLLIIDKDNNLIASTETITWDDPLNFNQLKEQNTIYNEKIMDETYAVSYAPSKNKDWKYVFLQPSKVFTEKLRYLRLLIMASVSMCLVIGGIVSYFFSKRHYIPINNIVQTIGKKAGISLNQGYNEYKFIEESISHTLNEKEKVQNILQQQNFVLKSNLIMRLLKGRTESSRASKELLQAFNMNFISERFAVLLFYIEDYEGLFQSEGTENPWEQLKLVQFILCNLVEELFEKDHRAFIGDVDGTMMVCLVNTGIAENEKAFENINGIINEAKIFLKDKFFINLTISISNIHQTSAGITEAYQEALDAMEYRMILGSGGLIPYKDIGNPKPVYAYSLEQEHQLINHIKAGDYESSKKILVKVFSDNLSSQSNSVQMAKCILSDLVSTMIKAMTEVNYDGKEELLDRLNPVDRVLQANSVMDMKYHIADILQEICQSVEQNKKSQHTQLRDNIMDFIHINYMDMDLSVNKIGEQFQLTPAYMSKLFKEQTGVSIPDYINDIRIRKAKELLKESRHTIGQIAERIGYNNSNAFIRSFKRCEGVTPGQFKEVG